MKEEAGIRTSRQTIDLIPAFSNHRCTISVQLAIHNIMLISISVASTLSVIKLKSSTSVVCPVVLLNVLLFFKQDITGGRYGHVRDPSFCCS